MKKNKDDYRDNDSYYLSDSGADIRGGYGEFRW